MHAEGGRKIYLFLKISVLPKINTQGRNSLLMCTYLHPGCKLIWVKMHLYSLNCVTALPARISRARSTTLPSRRRHFLSHKRWRLLPGESHSSCRKQPSRSHSTVPSYTEPRNSWRQRNCLPKAAVYFRPQTIHRLKLNALNNAAGNTFGQE